METYKKKKILFNPLKFMVNHSIIVTLKRKKFLTCNLLAGYIHEEVNIMNKYESVVIIDPAVEEDKVKLWSILHFAYSIRDTRMERLSVISTTKSLFVSSVAKREY